MSISPEQEIDEATEAYLTFGGWAKSMPNPPKRGDRRRYTVDVECTSGSVKSTEKGERHTRGLSILRVVEVVGAEVPPRDDDENQPALPGMDGEAPPDDEDAEDGPWPGDADHPDTDAADKPENVAQFKSPGKK